MAESALAFALVAGLLTITPGAESMLVLSSAVRGGVASGGLSTAFGTVSGVYCWGIAAAAGASAVLTASETAYGTLKAIGAAYLVWLGVGALRASMRPGTSPAAVPDAAGRPAALASYGRGLLTNLLNPKIGVFYISFLPQFLPENVAALPAGVALTTIHVVEGLVFLTAVALARGPGRPVASPTPRLPRPGPRLRGRVHRIRAAVGVLEVTLSPARDAPRAGAREAA